MSSDIPRLQSMKEQGSKIVMTTAYDHWQARLAAAAGVDALLVGDTLGSTMLGYSGTTQVTMEDMLHHLPPVVRGAGRVLVVADMPFGSFQVSEADTIQNAVRLIKEGGCQAVMLEGGKEILPMVRALTNCRIPVLAHIGLQPQTARLNGAWRTQGLDEDEAWELVETAQDLEEAGVFAIMVECVTAQVAKLITEKVDIPTIGMGSGVDCDGQLLLFHDLLGLSEAEPVKFVRRFAEGGEYLRQGLTAFCAAVREGAYPDSSHSQPMEADEAKRLY